MCRRLAAVLLVIGTLSLPAAAATRMMYEINGTPRTIDWAPAAFPLPYQIDQRLVQLDANAQTKIDRAFSAWQSIAGANVRFEARGTTATTLQRTEGEVTVSLADELFRNQGALAMTTYTFDDNGQFTDADIQIDPSLFNGSWNAQLAIEHEIGHALGLDHSAMLTAVMYPYVSSSPEVPPFDTDDQIAISTMYPRTDPTLTGATVEGRVMGDAGAIFAAQVVALNESGRSVATALTNQTGDFSIAGLPAGRYRFYVEPLDGPVQLTSLQGLWREARLVEFPTQFFDGPGLQVENGKIYGNLFLNAAGPSPLNPKTIGTAPPGATSMSLASSPVTVRPGQTFQLSVGGDGFVSGMTSLDVTTPCVRRISDFQWREDSVTATYVVDANATAGSAVVLVHSGRDTAALTGALRIDAPQRMRAVRH